MFYDEQHRVERLNAEPGNLTGYDCPHCMNRGGIWKVVNNKLVLEDCSCIAIRQSIQLAKSSGIEKMLDEYTFDNFRTEEEWQKNMFEKAKAYAADPHGWFFVGGQTGSGKTHICTAIAGELLKKRIPVRYML